MTKNLLIVESPAKAKTIEKYLGKDFKVKSSMGHIRDLTKGNNAIDIDNGFEPQYEISPDKTKIVKDLRDWVKKVDEVWLATDEDREGEAISWHLCKVLGLDENITKRIVFREITKPAIVNAISNPRRLDLKLVDAQQARRILDRLVGFELSGLLWKKIKGQLSAGRVQSVALKLIVERERNIAEFDAKSYFDIQADFLVNDNGRKVNLLAKSPKSYDDNTQAEAFLKQCLDAIYTIDDIRKRPLKRKPAAPFTTSTLQQEASRKLGFAVSRTMRAAQRLYEAGHITYMRTDSINLSEVALAAIATEIETAFGKKYLQTRRYKTKKKDAQEAHEAIRPTYIEKHSISGGSDEEKLYDLIWKRTIASQMSEAILEKTTVNIAISTHPEGELRAEGEVLKFDGFLKVYIESTDDEDQDEDAKGILPPLAVGDVLDFQEMQARQKFRRPPARFTEAGLVKEMEQRGIGRPSTYAPTISKIMDPSRGYVVKESRDGELRAYELIKLNKKGSISKSTEEERFGVVKNRLFPTDIGLVVCDFLDKHFEDVMDYSFTADIEKQFDDIADGKAKWQKILGDFYHPFHKTIEETTETAERASGERVLGKDPVSGRTLLVRLTGKGNKVAQIGKPDELLEDEKPRYANLLHHQSLNSITLEEALKLFQLPRELGEFQGEEVVIGIGRFGPYVRHGEKFISIPKGEAPLDITAKRAHELILEKQKADEPLFIYQEHPVTQGSGRFGPYLKWNGLFVNIPRRYNPETITKSEAIELIDIKIEKEANRYIKKWDDEKIALENGRWGPFIRFKKKSVKLPKIDDKRMTPEQAKELSLDEIKKIIEAELPGAFKTAKKAAPKKKSSKKK